MVLGTCFSIKTLPWDDKLFEENVEVDLLTCRSREMSQWWLQQILDNSFIYPKSKVLLFWTLGSWCSSKAAVPTMQQVTSCQAGSHHIDLPV